MSAHRRTLPYRLSQRFLVVLAATLAIAACESRPATTAPDGIEPQLAPGGMTTVLFQVRRADNGAAVPHATISVYLDAVSTPTWLIADANGNASIDVPSGAGIGYLARLLPPEWLNLTTLVVPPPDPGTFTAPAYNDLGAVTCGNRGPLAFNPGRLSQCVSNRYLVPRGPSVTVDLALPVQNARSVIVRDLAGNELNGAHTYLVEALPQAFPWQNLPAGVKSGLLRFYGKTGPGFKLPGAAGYVEVYGTSGGFEVAGTEAVVDGANTTIVETSPVICTNPAQTDVEFSISRPVTNPAFTFTEARWAFAARRGSVAALDKDLTTSAVVLQFVQSGGPQTVEYSQRMRTSNGTYTATVSLQCTQGVCDIANATTSVPGTGNPMRPVVFQPKTGKLFFVVQGLDPAADTEWSVKAQGGGIGTDQLPVASKNGSSSAYLLFSKAFTFCDPDFSFDGSYGCDI